MTVKRSAIGVVVALLFAALVIAFGTAGSAPAPGGARNYLVNGEMSGGFALVAWPAQYNVTGVMTFIVSADAVVREKDLGATTDSIARTMTQYNPDGGWHRVQ